MKIALVLHLYQPPTQDEAVFRNIFIQCYQPLIKLIKSKKGVSFTLNLPLSLLEQADKYGYHTWLGDLKDLYVSERIEVTGSGAYHPLLTKLEREAAERQIVLNEYGMGYYLGSRTGFEGESAVMTKNIGGFFAPECAVNYDLISLIADMGYDWVLVDQTAVSGAKKAEYEPVYYKIKDLPIKIVPRNKGLSDRLSFFRGSSVDELVRDITSHGELQVLALDGETFGHHNSNGIELLEDMINIITQKGGSFVTVRQLTSFMKEAGLPDVVESTWGASYEDMSSGEPYPYWSGNELQEFLCSLEKMIGALITDVASKLDVSTDAHDSVAQPLWFFEDLPDISQETKNYLKTLFFAMKYEHSDKYWWSSRKPILGNPCLYNKHMVEEALKYADGFEDMCDDANQKKKILMKIEDVRAKLSDLG